VEFLKGVVCQYLGVSEIVFERLMSAPSFDEYLNKYISDQYAFIASVEKEGLTPNSF